MEKTQSAREVALNALVRCEKSGYSNLVLAEALKKSSLDARDRAFVTRIVYGTVERRLTLEARLAPFLQRPLSTMPADLRCILRSGLYQMLYMDSVPESAAVNESVSLAKRRGQGKAAGFVNAVLRRAGTAPFAPVFEQEEQRLSVTYSIGLPIVRLLLAAYPQKAEEICAASFAAVPFVIRVNTLKTTPAQLTASLLEEGVEAHPAALENALLLQNPKDVTRLAAFAQGLFHVQGLASQFAVYALQVSPGDRVLDVCAAPGGKSATIAQYLQGEGSLTACELHQSRVGLVKEALRRIGADNAEVCCADAASYDEKLGLFDRILCDVPCSGLGTLAKKPDIRYKDLSELSTLIKTQEEILSNASRYLLPGGVLVYSTCTINPAENEQVVRRFLAAHPEFFVQPVEKTPLGGQTVEGMTLFLPSDQSDGFFVARLEKKP